MEVVVNRLNEAAGWHTQDNLVKFGERHNCFGNKFSPRIRARLGEEIIF